MTHVKNLLSYATWTGMPELSTLWGTASKPRNAVDAVNPGCCLRMVTGLLTQISIVYLLVPTACCALLGMGISYLFARPALTTIIRPGQVKARY